MTFSISEIITGVIKREGPATSDPVDHGGRTSLGISEAANPAAWADGVVTTDEAQAIYLQKYVIGPHFDQITDDWLKAQLIDFGVTSGPALAIVKLQTILELKPDGVLGPITLAAANAMRGSPIWLSNRLVAARVQMIGRLVAKNPTQVKFLNGWLNRALEFLQP